MEVVWPPIPTLIGGTARDYNCWVGLKVEKKIVHFFCYLETWGGASGLLREATIISFRFISERKWPVQSWQTFEDNRVDRKTQTWCFGGTAGSLCFCDNRILCKLSRDRYSPRGRATDLETDTEIPLPVCLPSPKTLEEKNACACKSPKHLSLEVSVYQMKMGVVFTHSDWNVVSFPLSFPTRN